MTADLNHTLEWMRRLDRRFSILSDRFDQLEKRIARVEGGNADNGRDLSDLHQLAYSQDKRLERLEARFETVVIPDG